LFVLACLFHGAIPDENERSTEPFDLLAEGAQLRDLLRAEDSPKVAQEDQNRGSVLPQRSESNGIAVEIARLHWGEGMGNAHGIPSLREKWSDATDFASLSSKKREREAYSTPAIPVAVRQERRQLG